MAEQFVCQELLAYQPAYKRADIQYWAREKKNSHAEVDFVTQCETKILPIEVKAGAIGRLKSLQVMMQEKDLQLGIRVSQLPLAFEKNKNIMSLPFYLLSELERLCAK